MSGKFYTPWNVEQHIGETFTSNWIEVDQERINAFGATTEDPDPHHVDPEFCKTHSPWGKPIAFGFLTLSLLAPMLYDVYHYPLDADPDKDGYPASAGFDRIRLISPVPAGSRIRGHFTPENIREPKPGQKRIQTKFEIEIEHGDRPAAIGDWIMIWMSPTEKAPS